MLCNFTINNIYLIMDTQQNNKVSISARLREKQGRIRGNLMGTRMNMGGGRMIFAPNPNNNHNIQKPKPLT